MTEPRRHGAERLEVSFIRATRVVLVLMHSVIVVWTFGAAYRNPLHAMAPIIVFIADFPLSLFLYLAFFEHTSISHAYLIQGAVFLLAGGTWWWGIGTVLVFITRAISSRI